MYCLIRVIIWHNPWDPKHPFLREKIDLVFISKSRCGKFAHLNLWGELSGVGEGLERKVKTKLSSVLRR